MKKLVLSILAIFLLSLNVLAKNVIPVSPDLNNLNTIGVYQVGNDITIYKEPNEASMILYRVRWDKTSFFPEEIGENNFFEVFFPNKNLAYVNVVDYDDDWIEIIYDNSAKKTGWIKKDDPYKFMTWINFYNTYGKKYGLKILKGSPEFCSYMKSSMSDTAQNVSVMNMPQRINLNVIRGNWALVSVFDLDKTPKTGYIRWRSDDGIRYFFPAIK